MKYRAGNPGTLEKIGNAIREYEMILPGQRIVAGLSGGPDSACLLHALCCLRDELQIGAIIAVHVNHGLRGAESDRDEAYSRQLAADLGAEFRAFHFDIGEEAKRRGISTETAGRRARYAVFEEVCADSGAERIATAHNRNDQAETILMRILRGTGIHGLAGISRSRGAGKATVIRPLLDIGREEIEEYCQSCGLIPVRDHTNDEILYTRNRIRLELLPYLRKEYNADIDDALIRLGRLAEDDDDYLNEVTGKIMLECWNDEERSLSADGIRKLHPALAKRAVAEAAARSGSSGNVGEYHIRNVLSLVTGKKEGKEADLTGGRYVRCFGGKLWFRKRTENTAEARSAAAAAFPAGQLEREGSAEVIFGDLTVRLRLVRGSGTSAMPEISVKSAATKDRGKRSLNGEKADGIIRQAGDSGRAGTVLRRTVRLDWDLLKRQTDPVFRFRQPGDRIQPRGMKGHKKLQDFFVDRKVPGHLRDRIPLLACGREILSAGGEAAGRCCITPESTAIVSIEY